MEGHRERERERERGGGEREGERDRETEWESRVEWKRGMEVGVVRTEVGLAATSSVMFGTATASEASC
jgi:hypothetical protein